MRVRDVTGNAENEDDADDADDDDDDEDNDNMNGGAGGQVGFRLKRDCKSIKSHRRFAFVQPPQAGRTSSHLIRRVLQRLQPSLDL